jgi:hypothetical protein
VLRLNVGGEAAEQDDLDFPVLDFEGLRGRAVRVDLADVTGPFFDRVSQLLQAWRFRSMLEDIKAEPAADRQLGFVNAL